MKDTKKLIESDSSSTEIVSNLTEAETGLMVFAVSRQEHDKVVKALRSMDFYGEDRGDYIFFPEEPDTYDALERDLEREFQKRNIDVRYEGI